MTNVLSHRTIDLQVEVIMSFGVAGSEKECESTEGNGPIYIYPE